LDQASPDLQEWFRLKLHRLPRQVAKAGTAMCFPFVVVTPSGLRTVIRRPTQPATADGLRLTDLREHLWSHIDLVI